MKRTIKEMKVNELAQKGLTQFSESLSATAAHQILMAVTSVFNIKLRKIGGKREIMRRNQYGAVLATFYRHYYVNSADMAESDYKAFCKEKGAPPADCENRAMWAYNYAVRLASSLSDADIAECMQIAALAMVEKGDFHEARKAVRNYIESLVRHSPVGEKESKKAIVGDIAARLRAQKSNPLLLQLLSDIELTDTQARILELISQGLSQAEAHRIMRQEGTFNGVLSTFQDEVHRSYKPIINALEMCERNITSAEAIAEAKAEEARRLELKRANKRRAYYARKAKLQAEREAKKA